MCRYDAGEVSISRKVEKSAAHAMLEACRRARRIEYDICCLLDGEAFVAASLIPRSIYREYHIISVILAFGR